MVDLPTTQKFYQSFNFGIDYKNFDEDVVIGKDTIASPIEYYPISANYGATWMEDKHFTELNASLNFHLRGMGSDETDYANKRYNADGSFIYLRGDLAHTHDLKGGAQVFGKVQGQLASQPLINSEQIAGGGLGTVRGYLEATVARRQRDLRHRRTAQPLADRRGGHHRQVRPTNGGSTPSPMPASSASTMPLPGQRNAPASPAWASAPASRFASTTTARVDVAVPLIEQDQRR